MNKLKISKKKKYIIIFTITMLIVIFRICIKYYEFNLKYKNSNNYLDMKVTIIQNESISDEKICYLVKYKENQMILNIYKNKYENNSLDSFTNFKYGDILKINGKINIPEKLGNMYEFDYKKYLNSNNIVATISTYDAQNVGSKINNIIINYIYMYKDYIDKKLNEYLPQKERELFKSMVYGDDRNLDESIKDNFSKNGISHLLSVSGLNVANLLLILTILIKIRNEKIKNILKIILLIVFCLMCTATSSILRATIMSAIVLLFTKKKINIYIRLVIALIIILIINPYSIFNVGLILSFIATLGIVTYNNEVYTKSIVKLKHYLNIPFIITKKGMKYYIYLFLSTILKLISLNIAVYIAIIPIQIYYFNTYEFTSIISNLVIVPIASFTNLISILTVLFIPVPYISDILINSNYLLLKIIIDLSNLFTTINLPTLNIQSPDIFSILLYYILLLIKRFKKYDIVIFKKKYLKKARILLNVFAIFSMLYIVSIYVYTNYFENYIIYFNVEQGNMALIHYNRKNIIVDMGSTKSGIASNVLLNYMKKKAYKKIDLCIITHMHDDHVNGLENIASNIKIEKVAYSIPKSEDTIEYINFQNIINKNNISVIMCEKNDKIKYKNLAIHILSPPVDKIINANDKINANSMVFTISISNTKYLFMGDATIETEKYILNESELNNIKVIQIGHHGSKTSTSKNLLDKINAKFAIISSKKKVYGHPSDEVLNLLIKYHIKFFITEEKGSIKIKI